jgi:hypothetical protein
MKKAKIMLIAIAVLATVGGALAFKASKISTTYCTRLVADNSGACEGQIALSKFGDGEGTQFYYTIKGANCNVNCTSSTDFVAE